MELALIAAAVLTLAGSIPVVARVKREYESDRVLSGPTVVAVWLLYAAIVVVVALAAIVGVWQIGLPVGLSAAAGIALLAGGIALEAWGLASMASFRRMSGMQPDRPIESGAFRYSRNPQNVGTGIALTGLALLGDSALAVIVAAGFWTIFRVYVGYEEEHLARAFGGEYERYRQRTSRLLGTPG